jgi:Uma2 family endonuclease
METVKGPVEQRVVLYDISWDTYERLLADHLDNSVPRFTYDRGVLAIVSPLPEHEKVNRTISFLVELLAEEFEVDLENLGSTTFKREDCKRGFEPDTRFYIQNEERVRGKAALDLNVGPPPDLVIEVDITSPSVPRFPIYARFGVPEVWRYDGERMRILELENDAYVERPTSLSLPPLTNDVLTRFAGEGSKLGRRAWMREVREWARNHTRPSG